MQQEIIDIKNVELLNKTLAVKNAGYRLAQICATKLSEIILLYSYIKDEKLLTYRFTISSLDTVESISCLYPYAFMYENEIKDLFGVQYLNMNINFNGNFYKTAIKKPFNPSENEVKTDE